MILCQLGDPNERSKGAPIPDGGPPIICGPINATRLFDLHVRGAGSVMIGI